MQHRHDTADPHSHGPLAHHFDSLAQQHEAGTLGMWLFLATEILFFGGMFATYFVYRSLYPEAFRAASHHLDVKLGFFNTLVLLTSSFTMALAVNAAARGLRRQVNWLIVFTALCGMIFLGVKSIEYGHKFHEHLVPGPHFQFAQAGLAAHAQLFFCLYFVMTGFHALHIIIGMAIMLYLVIMNLRGAYSPIHYLGVELGGLYWHLVDIIWVYLFPLLYLIR